MTITLYVYNGENNVVEKGSNLTEVYTFDTAYLKENTDIDNPSFLIQNPDGIESTGNYIFSSCNYLYCTFLRRFYFITRVVIEANSLVRIECSVDTLMSFNDYIYAMTGKLSRNEYVYDLTNLKDTKELFGNGYDKVNTGEAQFPFYEVVESGNTKGKTYYLVYVVASSVAGPQSRTPTNPVTSQTDTTPPTGWCQLVDPASSAYRIYMLECTTYPSYTGGVETSLLTEWLEMLYANENNIKDYIVAAYLLPFDMYNELEIREYYNIIEPLKIKLNTTALGSSQSVLINFGSGLTNTLNYTRTSAQPDNIYYLSGSTTFSFMEALQVSLPQQISGSKDFYKNLQPYSSISVRVPFVGEEVLSNSQAIIAGALDNELWFWISYSIDMTTGKLCVAVYDNYSGAETIFLKEISYLIPLPISSSDAYQISLLNNIIKASLEKTQTETNQQMNVSTISAVGGIVTAISGALSLNIPLAAGGLVAFGTGLFTLQASKDKLSEQEQISNAQIESNTVSGSVNSVTSVINNYRVADYNNPRITVYFRPSKCLTDNETLYNKYFGRPNVNFVTDMSSVHGYTEFSIVHAPTKTVYPLPNFNESENIKQQLISGVYFPDPEE